MPTRLSRIYDVLVYNTYLFRMFVVLPMVTNDAIVRLDVEMNFLDHLHVRVPETQIVKKMYVPVDR